MDRKTAELVVLAIDESTTEGERQNAAIAACRRIAKQKETKEKRDSEKDRWGLTPAPSKGFKRGDTVRHLYGGYGVCASDERECSSHKERFEVEVHFPGCTPSLDIFSTMYIEHRKPTDSEMESRETADSLLCRNVRKNVTCFTSERKAS